MTVPSYIMMPVDPHQDEIDSVITCTFAEEDICRWEKLVGATSNTQPNKSSPICPRRSLSRRSTETSLDDDDDESPDKNDQSQKKRDSDPPVLPQRRETLLLHEYAANLAELNAFLADEDFGDDEADEDSLSDAALSFLEKNTEAELPLPPTEKLPFPVRRRSAIHNGADYPLLLAVDLMSSISSEDGFSDTEDDCEQREPRSSKVMPPKLPRRRPSIICGADETWMSPTASSITTGPPIRRKRFLASIRGFDEMPSLSPTTARMHRLKPVPNVSACRSA